MRTGPGFGRPSGVQIRAGAAWAAGLVGGAIVGLLDGVRAALVVGVDARDVILAALLAASVDALLGFVAAGIVFGLARIALWGRRGSIATTRWGPALMLAGAATIGVTVATFAATLDRHNRFLAGGITALATLGAAVTMAAIAPAAARAASGRRVRPGRQSNGLRLDPVMLLLLPFVGVLGVVMVLLAVERARPPFGSPATQRIVLQLAFVAAALPALLVATERLPVRLRLGLAGPAALVLYGTGLAALLYRAWSNHLRFLPWTHLLCGMAIATVAIGLAVVIGRRRLRAGPWWSKAVGVAAAALVALGASEAEPARKAVSRAGLAGPVLALGRRVLDRDRDGYARLLGGGDCDDGDPSVHPGVLDFPDDGIDQDCDGKDASVSVLAPPPFAAVPEAVPRDLNLLLVTIDTVRADHLGCYGYGRPTSPALDGLARESALFVNGWAHAPSTRYSMPAIATGRWPSAITWDESIWWPRIGPKVRTLAEDLKAAGYLTAAFFSFDYFSPGDHRGFERGVDVYRADRASLHRAVNGPMESRGSSSREMADDTIAFLEGHRSGKFFLWVHFYDPHLSYEPHAEVPSFGTSRVDLYDGEIRFTDLHLGRVLARLRELGLWDRTAVVVTGDHGEGFGEHGVTEHGFDLYAAQTKVPFIVRVPGLPARKVQAPAGHVDIAPTLLNLARAGADPAFLGRSLVGELAGGPAAGSPGAPASSPPSSRAGAGASAPMAPRVFQEVTSERGKKRALVTEDWHVIWNWTPENTTECYDLRRDPLERHDVWGRRTEGAGCPPLKSELQGLVSALSVTPEVAARLKSSVFPAGAAAPRPQVPLGARFGEVVSVVGYSSSAPVARPGSEVEVTLLFESLKPVTGGWRFFFHLMGPAGLFRNLDHVPVDGAFAVDAWRKGQRILDRIKIAFPPGTPPGDYRLIAGLYRGSERLPVSPAALSDGNKALRLTTIHVP
ncbi:MAG TPA: sulfatase-like hydrolase/transferase [Polyangia bacterium]